MEGLFTLAKIPTRKETSERVSKYQHKARQYEAR